MTSLASVRQARGLTLVEVLLCVGIMGILLSILLPAAARARDSARQTVSCSNLRQIFSTIEIYANDSGGRYPAIVEGRMYQVSDAVWVSYSYWQIASVWPGVIYNYLAIDEIPDVFISPGSLRHEFPSSYAYSTSFAGSPLLWREEAAARPEYRRGQRVSDVTYPSAKVLLWDEELGFLRDEPRCIEVDLAERVPTATADGAVRVRIPVDATVPVVNPFQHPLDHQRLHNTRHGVAGVDYLD
ncbi:MAG: type II secretion system protein [Leptolyngbya sp. PLA3]|nr:MAG: type II secretion system protein [Cyanobacteria bacterium CYA]MCE7967857.1 type II secretion system protein [Leptolyngbya sp. PL-A3]